MLLSFKREFPDKDTLKCFEILRSQHLEVYSLEAELVRDDQRRKDFMKLGENALVSFISFSTRMLNLWLCPIKIFEMEVKNTKN